MTCHAGLRKGIRASPFVILLVTVLRSGVVLGMPDQTHAFVTAGYGSFISNGPPATATQARFADNDYVTAALTPDGTLGMAYLPQGGTITVATSKLQDAITARWFDPAANAFTDIAGSPFSNAGAKQFTPPGKNGAGESDWVLVLETESKR